MTDRAKQIEEMAIGVCEYRKARGYKKCDDCDGGGECGVTEYARELYDAGYRKQSEVAREILQKLIYNITANNTNDGYLSESIDYSSTIDDIKELAAEYGVEVEE